ncbi:condensation domain-containing protein [Serratia fonticola]|uniref:condensation domain-containing protein n=1 Tax=Serratia fonticola TaxID=47917 RepID=UPI002178DD46|nr:condensation domain-containing protein [Serratia fonticola]CAI1858816.1 Dimodular nonribosomal peptide synthase [Serratia fonticola]CAI1883507.1 Dimodular nonribosomal peptide synthase [Serratia fonticola]CAI1935921.1 Dimodular nonribosomal peptide synthase [Serratia fonticola]
MNTGFSEFSGEEEAASEFEQQAWFEHQQQLHGEGQQVLAWQLTGVVDYGRLVNVLEQAQRQWPGINARYVYGERGLMRSDNSCSPPAVTIQTIRHPQEAIDALLSAKAIPFDLEQSPPLRFMLFSGDRDGILGMVVHRILSASLDWRDIPHKVSALYQQQVPPHFSEPFIMELLPQAVASPVTPGSDAAIRQHILQAFREALAVPTMGEHDDFFDFGGHSLIATRIIGRLKSQQHLEININDLFSYPSAAQLARYAYIANNVAASPGKQAESLALLSPQAPLSLAQRSLWKIYQALGCGEAFNIPFALRFLDPIDEGLFFQAFQDILLRHPALRTLFVDISGEVFQQIVPPEMLSQYEWFWHSQSQDMPLDQALQRAASHHFELDDELPVRITFLRDEENGQQVVSLLFHHIVLDEWSVNILMDELAQAMANRSAGSAPEWPQTPPPFHAFAIQQQQAGVNDRHLRFWLERLHPAPSSASIFASEVQQADAASHSGNWVEFKLEQAVSTGLYRLAKQQGASLFNVVYSGIAAALNLLGGAKDLVIGTSASGRNDAQFFDTIGYFTTVVAHRIGFTDDTTLNALIDDVKRQINDSLPFSDIPIDLVEEGLFGDRASHDSHMFEVFIQLHAKNKLNGAFSLADGQQIRFRQIDPEKTESVLGLQFEVMEEQINGEPSVRVMLSYRTDRYSCEQVQQIVQTTRQVFAVMADSVGQPALRLDALRHKRSVL